jgi:FkbM family methyltransferase
VHGFDLLIHSGEDVGRHIIQLGTYEELDAKFLSSNIEPEDTCFDVGANTGFYTMLMASRAVRGAVHSFEPLPLNWHLMCAGCLLNGYRNVVLNKAALGDRVGDAQFSQSVDSAFSSFRSVGRRREAATIRVKVETLDGYLHGRALNKVDVMKIDVEGAELLILRGAKGLLSDPLRRPRLLMAELVATNLHAYGCSPEMLIDLLGKYGYSPHYVNTRGQLAVYSASKAADCYNVFFVQPSKDSFDKHPTAKKF